MNLVKGLDYPVPTNNLARTSTLPSMSLYAEYVQLDRGLAFTIYRSSTQTPTRRLGCVGDLFIREEDHNLFYKVDEEINYVRSTSRHHVFPARWRPVPTDQPCDIFHPENRHYRLIAEQTRPTWAGLRRQSECSLIASILVYCHLKRKHHAISLSPEL